MRLVIFDIDGTLTATMKADEECFVRALADDALDRESIMRLSRQREAERYGRVGSTVYVGDGVWDARACRSIGIPFIGIATGSRATRLSAEGAVCVFPDYRDTDLFLSSVYETTNVA